jgi:hypothetical protein
MMKTNMNVYLKTSFLHIVTTSVFLFTTTSGAAVITDSGVDTVTKHFVIDSTISTATHEPGLSFLSNVNSQAQTFSISGQFDVNFSRYWWNSTTQNANVGTVDQSPPVIVDGIPLVIGPISPPYTTYEENWLTFSNVDIKGNLFPNEIKFPYIVRIIGTELSGDNNPCSLPFGPGTSCTGYTDGFVASLRGQFENEKINLQGWYPVT